MRQATIRFSTYFIIIWYYTIFLWSRKTRYMYPNEHNISIRKSEYVTGGWYTRLRWWWCVHSVPHIMPISLGWQKWALFMSYQAISSESTIHMNIQFWAVIFAHSSFARNARYSSTINHLYSRAPLNIRLMETWWMGRLRCDAGKYSEFWRWTRNDEKCCGLAAVVMCWVELMRLARGSGWGRCRTSFSFGIGKGKKMKIHSIPER